MKIGNIVKSKNTYQSPLYNINWKRQTKIIIDMINKQGYVVKEYTDAEDRVELEDKIIHINSRKHAETRFYILLHEFGHLDIYENCADEFAANHPVYVWAHDGRTYHSRAGKVSLIAEEIEAWKKGREIARSKNLYINDVKYNNHMTESLMGYINWASEE